MKGSESSGLRQTGTVLIVDDGLEDIRFAQRVITGVYPQICPKGVQSGEQLIRYVQGENEFADRTEYPYPTLVLLDLKMPGMHGFDVLRWLGNHPPHNLIPVVVLTVSGEVPLAQYAYQLGARSFLTKPLTANELKNMMKKFESHLQSS
jgi:CheY-like chemotaxis protein